MAILNYLQNGEILYLTESARDAALHDNDFLNCRICVLHDNDDEKERTNNILALFDKTIDDCRTTHVVIRDINPWLMLINENVFIIYFGEDTPIIKLMNITGWSSDYYKWTGISYANPTRPLSFAYVEVEEEDKMFMFYENTYHFEHHSGVDKVNGQYITQYDYTDETYELLMAQKIEKDKAELLEAVELRNDLERRIHTAGYCSVCGTSNAMYTVNPYLVNLKGDYTYHWYCQTCYNNLIAKIIQKSIYVDEESEYIGEEVQLDNNGYEYVDMGLSVSWATCNIGSSEPEETGLYFAWGETTGYPDASSGKKFSWSDYDLCNGLSSGITKYCTSNSYGTADNLTTLEYTDDAAHINMGGDWRMPTKLEMQELCDACDITWTTKNGVNGLLFKLKVDNNKQLFFPATDNANSGIINAYGVYGYYWTSSLVEDSGYSAYSLSFGEDFVKSADYTMNRYNGFNVRGVLAPPTVHSS